jgi:hypothetical protein
MKIKYSPCKTTKETSIEIVNENSIKIDAELIEFASSDVAFSDIAEQTENKILAAERRDGELYLTIRRLYKASCGEWDTGDYHKVTA